MMKSPYILSMNTKNTRLAYWKTATFRRSYLDGLTAFSFLVTPYRPKPIPYPTIEDAWDNVGLLMSGAIAEYAKSEEVKEARPRKISA